MRLPLHDSFFYSAVFFLIGVAIASGTARFTSIAAQLIAVTLTVLAVIIMLWLYNKKYLLPYVVIIIVGSGYYAVYATYVNNPKIPLNKTIVITDIIIDTEHHFDSQELTLKNHIKIYADRYPEFNYGDEIQVRGIVKKTRSPFLAGTVNARYSPITLVDTNKGTVIKTKLIALRKQFENNLKAVLPNKDAAFVSGLTVGTTEEFSKEFKEKLQKSGTSHITALSGANITSIVKIIAGILGYFFARRKIFWPTILIIIFFVMMTGAESSLVRAAIMGIILLAAHQYERLPSLRNIITLAAFGMVLYNPKLLAFDLGFELSFLAILGIEYIAPLLQKAMGAMHRLPLMKEISVTIGAQLAVTPLLIIKTGVAAPWAAIPNILIGTAIPWTMSAGFITGALGFISPYSAFFPALITQMLTKYEMAIINLFAFGS